MVGVDVGSLLAALKLVGLVCGLALSQLKISDLAEK